MVHLSCFNTLWPQFRLLSIRAQGHPLEQLPVPIGIAAGALPAQAGLRITSAWPSQHSCWLLLLFEGFQFCNVPLQIVLICLFGNFIMGGDFSFFFFFFFYFANWSYCAAQYRAAMQISKPESVLTDSKQTVERTGHLQLSFLSDISVDGYYWLWVVWDLCVCLNSDLRHVRVVSR